MKTKDLIEAMAHVLGLNESELKAGYDAFVADFLGNKEVVV